jgi:group II intron reverse transcriptase/maturase
MMQVKKKKMRVHSLTGRIDKRKMLEAFKAVKKNRGAAGIDKQSIQMFEANLEQNLEALMCALKTGTYDPLPLKRVNIPKGNGKFRPLGIPVVKCRVGQAVLNSLMNPIFEKIFHESSHGFRAGRSCHTAITELLEYFKQGYNVVVEADITGFFDNILQKLIMAMCEREIADGNILNLIRKFLRAGVMVGGKRKPTRKGTPQGGVISPLLGNLVLNHLDWELDAHGYKFVRYADDFVVLCKSKEEAEKALLVVKRCIEADLGLELTGFEFLGFYISSSTVRMRSKAEEKFKDKVRAATKRSHNFSKKTMENLNRIIRGTVNYFAQPYSKMRKRFRDLDEWIRKRLRCMKFKRIWRTDNKRLKNKHLKRLGLLSCRDLCIARQG